MKTLINRFKSFTVITIIPILTTWLIAIALAPIAYSVYKVWAYFF